MESKRCFFFFLRGSTVTYTNQYYFNRADGIGSDEGEHLQMNMNEWSFHWFVKTTFIW